VINFLEQREAVDLVLSVAVAVGALVTMVVCADGLSGERERGTLESLLLTPVSRRSIVVGKLTAAMTVWLAAFVVTVPYVWVLGRGVFIVGDALWLGFTVGTLVALGLGAFGLLVSALSGSNRVSLAVCALVLLALYAPTQLPGSPAQSGFYDVLLRVDPVAAGLHYSSSVLVRGYPWTRELSYLAAPVLVVLLVGGTLLLAAPRLVRLQPGPGSA
jgi:ABC-2 type transport system permease protein